MVIKKEIMKIKYNKTVWVDNSTPVNAEKLNKIENALEKVYTNSLSASEIVEGDGIEINTTQDSSIEISVSKDVMKSSSATGIEVIEEDPNLVCEDNKLYYILRSGKLNRIMINGVNIYEVE